MLDAAVGPPPPAPAVDAGWREALGRWARAHRAALQRNSWALRIPISGPPATPNSVAWWEHGLRALEGTVLDEGAKISVILLVSGFVRNEVLMLTEIGQAVASSGADPEEVMRRYERTLRRLADPVRYPAVARMLDSGIFTGTDEPDFDFEFGLGTVLDGVEVLIAREGAEREE